MSTEQARTAPYGSWVSPIKLDDVVAAGASLSSLIGDGADLWWLETRPDQDGRSTVMAKARQDFPVAHPLRVVDAKSAGFS